MAAMAAMAATGDAPGRRHRARSRSPFGSSAGVVAGPGGHESSLLPRRAAPGTLEGSVAHHERGRQPRLRESVTPRDKSHRCGGERSRERGLLSGLPDTRARCHEQDGCPVRAAVAGGAASWEHRPAVKSAPDPPSRRSLGLLSCRPTCYRARRGGVPFRGASGRAAARGSTGSLGVCSAARRAYRYGVMLPGIVERSFSAGGGARRPAPALPCVLRSRGRASLRFSGRAAPPTAPRTGCLAVENRSRSACATRVPGNAELTGPGVDSTAGDGSGKRLRQLRQLRQGTRPAHGISHEVFFFFQKSLANRHCRQPRASAFRSCSARPLARCASGPHRQSRTSGARCGPASSPDPLRLRLSATPGYIRKPCRGCPTAGPP